MSKYPLVNRLLGWALVVAQALLMLGLYSLALEGNADGINLVFTVIFFALGIALLAWSVASMGSSLWPTPTPRENSQLVTKGPYRFIRHPMYAGILLIGIGVIFRYHQWTAVYCWGFLAIVLLWKMGLEERLLVERFPEYPDYQKRTGFLLPPLP